MAATPVITAHITANTSIQPAVNAYEIYLNDQGRSPYTVKAFLSDLRLMASYFPPDRALGAITTADLNNYFDWMQHERPVPCSPKTLARRITTTKSFFRWLHKNGVLMLDPAEKVVQHSVMSPLPVILTDEEVQAVMLAADRYRRNPKPDARPYTLLYLLLTTGIKKSECLGIHLNHIDLDAKTERMHLSATRARQTDTRNARSCSKRIGSLPTTNMLGHINPWISSSPGRRAGWNICLKISARMPALPNTSHSICAVGLARYAITNPASRQIRSAKSLAYQRFNGVSCSSS